MFRLPAVPEDDTIYLLKIIVVPSGIDPLRHSSCLLGRIFILFSYRNKLDACS